MLDSMGHRGPDHRSIGQPDKYVLLGHNRLRITDPDPRSDQPMCDVSNKYSIVFNGEIYNYREIRDQLKDQYRFVTQGDTETVLAAYTHFGARSLENLNGMFAIAIWDEEANELFLARDRFGVKPLYYAMDETSFLFASEIKALWAAGVKKSPNHTVWSSYFQHGTYGMPQETFWKNVHQLPPGHFLRVRLGQDGKMQLRKQKWYSFSERVSEISRAITKEEAEHSIEQLLHESVALRYKSDVPVGLNLSGGLDSAILLSLAGQLSRSGMPITAFHFYTNDHRYDETQWVQKLKDHFDFHLIPCLLRPEEVASLNEKISHHQDEPFGGIPVLAYSKIFKAASELGLKVLLDGQGMDEVWAGYDYYQSLSRSTIQGVSKSPFRPEVLNVEFLSLAQNPDFPAPFDSNLLNLQYRDIFYTKLQRALRFNDRISMMYSVELREPFLDYRLMELVFALPEQYKTRNNTGKWLLREWARQHLPASVGFAPKRALQTPQREWLAGELRDFTEEKIEKFATLDFTLSDRISEEWENYLSGDQASSFHIWQWISAAQFFND